MALRARTVLVLLVLAGCAPLNDDRQRLFTEDGVWLYHRGQFREARECFEAALQLDPGNADLAYNLGQCHDRLGQRGKAEELYRACLARSPNHAEAWHGLTVLLYETDRKAEATQRVRDW